MRKKLRFIFIILAAAVVNLFLGVRFISQFEEFRLFNSPISMETISEEHGSLLAHLDTDNDGVKELIFGQGDYNTSYNITISKHSKTGTLAPHIGITVPSTYLFLDAGYKNNRNRYELLFMARVKKKLYLRKIDQYNILQGEVHLKQFIPPARKVSPGFNPLELTDINGDGKDELLFLYVATYPGYPRGFACHNPESGELLWRYLCGPMVRDVIIRDLDGDDTKEIIFSTVAPNNGAETNGTNDSHSYVIALSSEGKELWKQQTGGWYTTSYIDISDLDGDGALEIVAATSCHQVAYKQRGRLFVFDSKTGQKKNTFLSMTHPFQTLTSTKPLIIPYGFTSGTPRDGCGYSTVI